VDLDNDIEGLRSTKGRWSGPYWMLRKDHAPARKMSIVLVLVIVLVMVMMMSVGLRTGGIFHKSTTRLAVVAAAILAQHHAAPQVARQLVQLFGQRHGLVQVRQEVAEISFGHLISYRLS
jgi:hypothetical protein